MKKLFTIFACASFAFTLSAQDAVQPKGSWYLGTGDATELLNIFSSGVTVNPTVGYAVIDNLVVGLSVNAQSATMTYDGNTYNAASTIYGLGVTYFFSDNYYGGLGLGMLTLSETDEEDITGLGLNATVGKYIPFKHNLYLNPNLSYNSQTLDYGGSIVDTEGAGEMVISIGFGARF
jgi:hypothetical protein